jgi:hypothetical protein
MLQACAGRQLLATKQKRVLLLYVPPLGTHKVIESPVERHVVGLELQGPCVLQLQHLRC